MDPKKIDGDRFILQIKLPPSVHLLALVGAGVVAGVVKWFPTFLTPLLGSLGVLIAYYTAFYARQAIKTSHHNAIVSATIEYSRRFGDSRVQEARWALGAEYEALSSTLSDKLNSQERTKATGDLLAQKIGESKPEPVAGERVSMTQTLFDDAITLLDYCEDLAVGIERGALDDITAQDLLRSAVCQLWSCLSPFVDNQRKKRAKETFYVKFQTLAGRWQQ